MDILSTSCILIRKKTWPVILAVLLYLLPNLVQDAHRLFGHLGHSFTPLASESKSIQSTVEKCPVCVFEFYSVDDAPIQVFKVLVANTILVFNAFETHQLTSKVFDYSQLRAPPVS